MKFKKRLFMVLCCLIPAYLLAKPAAVAVTALTVAPGIPSGIPVAKSSTFYRFEAFSLRSADQQRHYQVTVGIPNGSMPEQGHPVLYMLDGNAALPALTDELFARLQSDDWPVIVTIGYKADAQIARAYDYTPPVTNNTALKEGPQFGGAEQFGQLVEQVIKPQVAQRVTVDRDRQALWGHSFGGLFVLHTLFNHPASFQTYIAVDPSLWWQQGQILTAEQAFSQNSVRPTIELLLQRSASHRSGDTLPRDETRRLAERLSQLPELTVQYADYFQHDHGSIRSASIPSALRMVQGVE